MPTTPEEVPCGVPCTMDTTRRGNYDSGEDFVLEYGELRFTFNERDFAERCEQAALQARLRRRPPRTTHELEDLVNLAVNGEIQDPASAPGRARQRLLARARRPADRSLVHWLRRLVFRSAWLDQRVKEGELDVALRRRTRNRSRYIQPDRDGEPIELAPEPSWGRVAYHAALGGRPAQRRVRARLRDRVGAGVADQQLRAQRAAGREVERREAAARGQRRRRAR